MKNPRKDLEECFGRDFEPDARKALAELRRLIREAGDSAVVLVEGRRAVPELDHARLVAVGEWLAREFPAALFRSGNAEGADSLFATGVGKVDPCRLQLVLPNPTMGRSRLIAGAAVYALDGASAETKRLLTEQTKAASPRNASLIEKGYVQQRSRPLAMRAMYLVRDTLKVIGDGSIGLTRATAALFYVDLDDPMAGGTGHTLRVCRQNRVPIFTQREWWDWT